MSKRQYVIIAVGAALLSLNALFPPREQIEGWPAGRHLLLWPGFFKQPVGRTGQVELYRVNLPALVAGSIFICGATTAAVALVALRDAR